MPIPLEELVEGIRSGCCAILLGPDVARNGDGEWMQSGLLQHLKEQLGVEEDVDNLIKCDAKTKSRAYTHLRAYYDRNKEPNDLHRQLALLPVPLIVSTTPDRLMEDALESFGIPHQFRWYSMNDAHEPVDPPSNEQPLVYNLFGCIEDQQSMILTHSDLLRFIFSVLGAFKPPQELTKAFRDAQYFLFLGFDFDKWYLQLLFQLFISEGKISIAVTRDGEVDRDEKDTWPDTIQPTSFYSDKYGVEFSDDSLDDFVRELSEACASQGLLREVREAARASIGREIDDCIRRDELEDALDRLYDHIENVVDPVALAVEKIELLNEINSHVGVLTRNEKNVRKGIVSKEDADVERQRIIQAIQAIVAEVEV